MGDAPKNVLAIARKQLGLSAEVLVPQFYINELNIHFMLYPHDDNFRVTLEPKRGYGKVTCLEEGCGGVSIPLNERFKVPDRGKSDGLGSLSPYRLHIATHPTHAKNRLARVEAQHETSTVTPSSNLKRLIKKEDGGSLLNLLDTNFSLPAHSMVKQVAGAPIIPASAPAIQRVSSLVRLKPEDVESTIPYKRLLDTAFDSSLSKPEGDGEGKQYSSPSAYSSVKRLKTAPNTPLSQLSVNNATTRTSTSLVLPRAPTPSSERLDDLRLTIQEVQSKISHRLELVNHIIHKSKKTSGDLARMDSYMRELDDLQYMKEQHLALFSQLSDIRRPAEQETIMPSATASGPPGVRSLTPPPAFYEFYPAVPNTYNPLQQQPAAASGSDVLLDHFPRIKEEESAFFPHFNDMYDPPMSSPFPYYPPEPEPKREPSPMPYIASKVAGSAPATGGFGAGRDRSFSPQPHYVYEEDAMYPDPRLQEDVLNCIGINVPAPLRGAENFDEEGNFHGRGREEYTGPRARADDIEKFLIEAGNAESFDGNASIERALEKLGLDAQYELLPGMEVALMPHQTIGVAWMLEKEASTFMGGCLGDDMGLGKTVQMISVMVKNQSRDPACKTNLIIAPIALLDQWKIEIETKTNCGLTVCIYHGSGKPKRKQDLMMYDITMSLEWPDYEKEMRDKAKARRKKAMDNFIASDSDNGYSDKNGRKKKQESGLLFQVEFYRIILDEAQTIRNRRTRTSRAAAELRSIYRWCLTGTPIINSLVDVYGYLRFLKVRPWYDFTEFQRHVGNLEKKNPGLAITRLQAIIVTFLLRRMKDSVLDGKRLIELPTKTVSLVRLEFSKEERDIYSMVEARTQATFNKFLRAGTVLKNYHQVLVLLLRLRQVCSHPSLIQEGGAAFIHPGENDEDENMSLGISSELARARRLVSPEFVDKLKKKFIDSALSRIQAEKESADAAIEDEECPICFDALTEAVVTPCGHIFCKECLTDVIKNTPPVERVPEDAGEAIRYATYERPCPACRAAICSEKLFNRKAFEPSDNDLFPEPQGSSGVEIFDGTKKGSKGKGKARNKRTVKQRTHLDSDDPIMSDEIPSEDDDDDDMNDFIVRTDEEDDEKDARHIAKKRLGKRRAVVVYDSEDEIDSNTPEEEEVILGSKRKFEVPEDSIELLPKFLPSTKMKYMMEQLKKLLKERPDEKILIVSQWTGCLSLVSDYLSETGIFHVKYEGDMNRAKRKQAIQVFMSKDKARVMLMSLKCGGVGLNLTRANNVISLDLGWSQAIEAQAFDRVHRLGQRRPVSVQRVVISDTVEDRVLAMQERKQTLADGSLGEGTGKKMGRLTVRELANLFGLDARGHVL
ncbi:SNF2 family N-terminal domain-containing protein [Crucibulum laeve]|uniref:SNF2 family N-terminal domain-containing protein n=1 Tax=Crucibulum laeve TaxID=68775 RepID=A0A5C3MDU1_9AGAR|nr:SNF2 family N-terminal domain-containing protein [Crucibulum laeve]